MEYSEYMEYLTKKLKTRALELGLVAGAAAVFYYVVLTPEARANIHKACNSVAESCHRMADSVQSIRGVVVEEDTPYLPNRESALEQWESIGF